MPIVADEVDRTCRSSGLIYEHPGCFRFVPEGPPLLPVGIKELLIK